MDNASVHREDLPMTIVVTGATGPFGRHVIETLLERGIDPARIVAAGRSVEKLDNLADRGVVIRRIDFDDPATLQPAFEGAEALLLVSGSEVGRRVPQHTNAIDAAVAAGVGGIVYTSAPHADTSDLVLAPEHKATEEAIRASGLPFTILRNGWYTENYVSTLEQARTSGMIIGSAGDGRVASASRADYAEAAAVALLDDEHAGRTYELTGDVAWTFYDLAAAIGSIIDREVEYTPLSPEEHKAALTASGLDEGTAEFVVALDGNIRDGLLGEVNGELSALIGRATTPLVDGLRAAVA
jgi:NAD(P)H dehydrogenase (quinone)